MPKYIYEYQWVDDDPEKWRMGSMSFAANGQWWHSRGTVLYDSPEEAHTACVTAIDVTHSFGRCGPYKRGGEVQRGAANWRIRITGVDATSHLKKRRKESLIK
tara:strand:+ start:1115 stop:1423 length:309 start_codon:yes stop_codon:yes gene_type:complete